LRPQDGEGYYLRAIANINTKDFRAVCEDSHRARELGSEQAVVLGKRYCRLSNATAARQK